jgi:hypothetical protein
MAIIKFSIFLFPNFRIIRAKDKKCEKLGDSFLKNNADLIDHYFSFSTSFPTSAPEKRKEKNLIYVMSNMMKQQKLKKRISS